MIGETDYTPFTKAFTPRYWTLCRKTVYTATAAMYPLLSQLSWRQSKAALFPRSISKIFGSQLDGYAANERFDFALYLRYSRQTARVYAAGQYLTKRNKQISPSCGAGQGSSTGGIKLCRYYGYYAVVSAKIFGRSSD